MAEGVCKGHKVAVCGEDRKIVLAGTFPDGSIGRAAGKARARDVDGAGKKWAIASTRRKERFSSKSNFIEA
jgi:hypothetical protein